MQQFEIKIFANPSGFQELKLTNAENLFTKEIVEKRNFDGDYGTFKEGTFSVLFTPKAFIIDYIFNVVADAGFRDPQTHIAIAIERGYIIKDAYQVFTKLRKEFNLIAAEYKVNIARFLYNKSESFYNIVEEKIAFAPDQYRISANEIDVTKRALASYETEEQLNSLLEEPNRLKFKSYSLVYFLKKIDASELYKKESINKYYTGIVMDESDFNFQTSYEVVFPDNHSITIKSRSDEIDYTCTKMYYKSERFYGTLNDHMEDWDVTQSEDRTKFFIGKKLNPEKKEIKVLCYDSKHLLVDTPPSLKFDNGKFSHQTGILVLTGAEIGEPTHYQCDDPSIEMKIIDNNDDFISFEITQLYPYNVSKVFNHVQKETGEIVSEIKLYRKGNRVPLATLTKNNPYYYDKIDPDNIEYEIPETKKYSSVRAGFANNCAPQKPQFQKKDTVDVELVIKDESIVNNLGKKPARCSFRTAHDDSEKHPQVKHFDEKGHLVLKEIPFGKFSYKIEIDGYKPEEDELNLYPKDRTKQIELTFEKTAWKKTLGFMNKHKGNAAILLIGLVIGGFLRPYVLPENLPEKPNPIQNTTDLDLLRVERERDSLLKIIVELKNDTAFLGNEKKVLEQNVAALEGRIAELEHNNQPEVAHPELIKRIIHLKQNEKAEVGKIGSTTYNLTYKKLSQSEQLDVNRLINMEAYKTLTIPSNINTIDDAIKYLKDNS